MTASENRSFDESVCAINCDHQQFGIFFDKREKSHLRRLTGV